MAVAAPGNAKYVSEGAKIKKLPKMADLGKWGKSLRRGGGGANAPMPPLMPPLIDGVKQHNTHDIRKTKETRHVAVTDGVPCRF